MLQTACILTLFYQTYNQASLGIVYWLRYQQSFTEFTRFILGNSGFRVSTEFKIIQHCIIPSHEGLVRHLDLAQIRTHLVGIPPIPSVSRYFLGE